VSPGPGRQQVSFPSGEERCAAWLYRLSPDDGGDRPAVVLGHGLGAVKEMGLDDYAQRFTTAGYVCLVFDYRHFGGSGGQPRQLLDIDRQLADWEAAVAYLRGLDGVDPDRVALFGSSFGGGHAIVTAARDARIAAVVAQCPFTDGIASTRALGLRSVLKVTPFALRDVAAAVRGAAPVRVDLCGPPGSAALMTAPDALPGYLGLVPEDRDFTNEVAARIGLRIMTYRPGTDAADVRCPILFCVCEHDSVAPAEATVRHARRAPHGEVIVYPVGHFDIYEGEAFERATSDQIAFLQRHLPPSPE
jgi:uncharacterized protein